jgi:hypothetical protein
MNRYLTKQQVCELLNCSLSTIERRLKRMPIKECRFGGVGNARYLEKDIIAFIHFNKDFKSCSDPEKEYVREVLLDE